MTSTADVARAFIVDLGATPTPGTIRAVSIWLQFESGSRIIGNNPWNLHSWGGLPGQTGYRYAGSGDRNVAVFGTLAQGVQASANNLIHLMHAGYGYDRVIAAVRSGSGPAVLTALANSSWSAGHYASGGVRGAKLFSAWNRGAGGSDRITIAAPKPAVDVLAGIPAAAVSAIRARSQAKGLHPSAAAIAATYRRNVARTAAAATIAPAAETIAAGRPGIGALAAAHPKAAGTAVGLGAAGFLALLLL